MNYNNLCFRCFSEKPTADKACPICGYKHTPNTPSANCLQPGTLLNNRYIVGIALGVGGFGITYKCLDTKIGGICAIKEYFPSNFALRDGSGKFISVEQQNIERYNKVMGRFVEEAYLLKSLKHPNIITIYDSFFENNTAYYVMEYCDGVDLRRYTNNFARKLEYDEGMNLLYQIMNGLEYIHSKGILHRDIAPDNIFVTKNNSVKILDFGSARSEMEQLNRELSVIVKVGYAPIEQYGGMGKQGPYTDIYALGATFYHLFTSTTPVESTQRVSEDTLQRFSTLRPDLPDNLKNCIEMAMELSPAKRISSIAQMKSVLGLGFNGSPSSQDPAKVQEYYLQDKKRFDGPYPGNDAVSVATRAGAYMMDLLIWGTVYFAIAFPLFNGDFFLPIQIVLFSLFFTLVNTVSELMFMTTPGKAIFRLRVLTKDGADIKPIQVVVRNFVKILNVFVVVFAENGELLEDRATNCIVRIKE